MNKQLEAIFTELHASGYKCYASGDNAYGFIITPDDNVLCIQNERFGGWNFSFEYVQSRQHGTGCQCLAQPVDSVSVEIARRAEQEGLAFAARLRATRYKSSAQWYKQYWNKTGLIEYNPA